jgi:hypothetical protein
MISEIDLLHDVTGGHRIRPARVLRLLSGGVLGLLCLAVIVLRVVTQVSPDHPMSEDGGLSARVMGMPEERTAREAGADQVSFAQLLSYVERAARLGDWSLIGLEIGQVTELTEDALAGSADVRLRARTAAQGSETISRSLAHPAVSGLRVASVVPTPEGLEADVRFQMALDHSRRPGIESDDASLPGALTQLIDRASLSLRSLSLASLESGQPSALAVLGAWPALGELVEGLEAGPTSTARVLRLSARLDQGESYVLEVAFTPRGSSLPS